MNRKAFLAAASIGIALFSLSSCQPSTVTNSPAPNATAPTETIDNATIESEIMTIENDWPRVIRERDGAAARRVYAEDLILIYPNGSVGSREQDARDTEAGNLTADQIEIAELKVKVLDKDAAIATGRSVITNGKLQTPDGKTIDISGQYRFVDTFARRNGQWKLEAGISTPIDEAALAAAAAVTPRATPVAGTSPAPRPAPATRPSPATRPAPATRPSPATRPATTTTPATNPTP